MRIIHEDKMEFEIKPFAVADELTNGMLTKYFGFCSNFNLSLYDGVLGNMKKALLPNPCHNGCIGKTRSRC